MALNSSRGSVRSALKIALILAFLSSCSSLVIIEPKELAGQIVPTPRVKTVGPLDWEFVIVAELVGPGADNLTDKIVLVDIPDGQSQEDMSRQYYAEGSLGVITPYRREGAYYLQFKYPFKDNVPYAGIGSYVWDGSDSKQLSMPSTELNLADYNLLMQFINNGTKLVVNMTSYDENPWDIVMGPGGIALTSVLTPLTAGSLVFCVYKWALWLRRKGFQWSLAQVVLIGNIIGNIIRLISISVDPMYSRRLCPNLFNHLFATGSWPFALSTTLLISFYWASVSSDDSIIKSTKINARNSSKKRKREKDDDSASKPTKKQKPTDKKAAKTTTTTQNDTPTPIFFDTPADLRAWFAENADTAPELILGMRKKASGEPSVNWKQAVDEALCYGWIDGKANGIDEKTYRQRFTPRRKGSIWSAVNIARVAVLTEEGRMTAAGLAAFEKRTEAKSAIYSHEQKGPITLPPEQEAIFRENKEAWAFFEKQPAGYKRRSLWHVISAKRAETKESRLTKLIEVSARKERLPMF